MLASLASPKLISQTRQKNSYRLTRRVRWRGDGWVSDRWSGHWRSGHRRVSNRRLSDHHWWIGHWGSTEHRRAGHWRSASGHEDLWPAALHRFVEDQMSAAALLDRHAIRAQDEVVAASRLRVQSVRLRRAVCN